MFSINNPGCSRPRAAVPVSVARARLPKSAGLQAGKALEGSSVADGRYSAGSALRMGAAAGLTGE